MQFYRCRCGNSQSVGSMAPYPCARCRECKSDLATHPENHREPEPHRLVTVPIDTDNGESSITRCRYCYRTKGELERLGEMPAQVAA